MCDLILKTERGCPADAGVEGVVFRHPKHGALEIVHVQSTQLPTGRWLIETWVTPATGLKLAFLEACEADAERLTQDYVSRAAIA